MGRGLIYTCLDRLLSRDLILNQKEFWPKLNIRMITNNNAIDEILEAFGA
jgi:hypothetical protein